MNRRNFVGGILGLLAAPFVLFKRSSPVVEYVEASVTAKTVDCLEGGYHFQKEVPETKLLRRKTWTDEQGREHVLEATQSENGFSFSHAVDGLAWQFHSVVYSGECVTVWADAEHAITINPLPKNKPVNFFGGLPVQADIFSPHYIV